MHIHYWLFDLRDACDQLAAAFGAAPSTVMYESCENIFVLHFAFLIVGLASGETRKFTSEYI